MYGNVKHLSSGNQTWLAGKSPKLELPHKTIIDLTHVTLTNLDHHTHGSVSKKSWVGVDTVSMTGFIDMVRKWGYSKMVVC
jgi:hypothetical protein